MHRFFTSIWFVLLVGAMSGIGFWVVDVLLPGEMAESWWVLILFGVVLGGGAGIAIAISLRRTTSKGDPPLHRDTGE